ncbi:MAG: sigma-54 dependent transcriptional regulator [bacterium]|nr:sigma-54 dependent transcriptional regulator [bacterium]MDT8395598.1 sigma-54 dependent transcriptional regulator [bacterium]
MERIPTLLMGIWRELFQDSDIQGATERIALLIREHLPLELLLVQRINLQQSRIETVGTGVAGNVPPPARTRNIDSTDLERLLAWCRKGEIAHFTGDDIRERELFLPGGMEGELVAGPLSCTNGTLGLLLLLSRKSKSLSPRHREVARALLEPFSLALDKAGRFREMRTEHETVMAEHHSLLMKLGRREIGQDIVGAESGLRQTMSLVEVVSPSDVPVLIVGETGSGKEVVARAVHSRSGRVSGPFIRVNCGAIPPELIDSELFGHERGSFTGAVGIRKGWFERADGGTLLLDEVGELPPGAQVRLLRVLQDGTFERVGGNRQLKVDVRVVAATHRDLQDMAAKGQFRSDLLYRIAVFPIFLPALRERPEDMEALAIHFSLRAARRFGLPALTPTREEVNQLVSYSWPGNVRELASVIDRAVLLGNGKGLEIGRALGFSGPAAGLPERDHPHEAALSGSPQVFPSLDTVIAGHIEAALRATNGRIDGPQGAAGLLKINPHTLRARMRKLGIDWKEYRQVDMTPLP